MGPMQTLISVVVARTGEEVSIDLRPGVAALLEHAERQLAAAEAVGAVGILGRPAAPATLTGEARLLLRLAPCTSVGAADAVAGVQHTIYSSGKWVGVGGGGDTTVLREALGVWTVRTSWLGRVSPLDSLSTYAIFLGRQRNAGVVARAVAAANEATADAEMLLAAALRDDRGRPSTSAAPSEDRAARLLFCLPSGGGGAGPEHPTGTSEAAAADDTVASTGAAEPEVRTVMAPFDIEYTEHRPGGGSNSVFKHTRQDARCPLCHRDERSVGALLQHFGALHTNVTVECFRAVSSAQVNRRGRESGSRLAWDRYIAAIRWLAVPMPLAGFHESSVRGMASAAASVAPVFVNNRAVAPGAVPPTPVAPGAGHSPVQPRETVDVAQRPLEPLRDGSAAGSSSTGTAILPSQMSALSFLPHPLAAGASRRRPPMSGRAGRGRGARRPLASALGGREYFHTGSLAPLALRQSTNAVLSPDSEDDIDDEWLSAMDAARMEALELPAPDVLFMALWTGFVNASPAWGDRGAAFLLASFFAARRRTILGAGLLPQAAAHVEVMYAYGLVDVDGAAQAFGVLTDRSPPDLTGGTLTGAANALDPAVAVIAAAAGVAASDAQAAAVGEAAAGGPLGTQPTQ